VFVYYGHLDRECWIKILGCIDTVEENAVNEIKSLQDFLKPYPNIAGLLLTGLEPSVSEQIIHTD